MANITKPAVERHSCDIAGCASMAENPMYWGVSFPVVAQDNYDDGSYFGGTRTRIINPVTIGAAGTTSPAKPIRSSRRRACDGDACVRG